MDVEGQNFALDFTSLEGQLDLYTDQTAAMVRRGVDIIIAPGVELALRSAVTTTKTLPIVMVAVDYDPLALGYVPSLSRPGGNVTGFTFQQLEQTEKGLQLLRDAFPDLRSATVLWDRVSADQWRIAQQVGPELGLRLVGIKLSGATQDYERLLGEAPAADRGALVVLMTPAVFPHRAKLAEAAVRLGMPSVSGLRAYAETGSLFSYGPSIDSVFERVADYVDRMARGTKAGELPIEQATRFEFVINLKNGEGARPHRPTNSPRARRRGDRMKMRHWAVKVELPAASELHEGGRHGTFLQHMRAPALTYVYLRPRLNLLGELTLQRHGTPSAQRLRRREPGP